MGSKAERLGPKGRRAKISKREKQWCMRRFMYSLPPINSEYLGLTSSTFNQGILTILVATLFKYSIHCVAKPRKNGGPSFFCVCGSAKVVNTLTIYMKY